MSWPARLDHGPVLPPARHAGVDQSGVAGPKVVGAEAQALGDSRSEALDEHVGRVGEPAHYFDTIRRLQIDSDRSTTAPVDIAFGRLRRRAHCEIGPVDNRDIGAQIGEHHRAKGRRTQPRDLDDANAGQRSGHHEAPSCPPAASHRPSTAFISSLLYVSSWRHHWSLPA